MQLPVIERPVYLVKLPSYPEPVKFMSYTVKESKILMVAKESEDPVHILNAIKQVIQNCLVDKINAEEIPMVDLEILYLNIQAKSSGETTDLFFECKNEVEGNACGMIIECSVNLLEVGSVENLPEKKIMFTEDIGVQLKLPSLSTAKKLISNLTSNTTEEILAAAYSLDKIFDKDSVYEASEAKESELIDFIEKLSEPNFKKIQDFVENAPSIKKEIEIDCPRCKFHHKVVLEGLEDFFV